MHTGLEADSPLHDPRPSPSVALQFFLPWDLYRVVMLGAFSFRSSLSLSSPISSIL